MDKPSLGERLKHAWNAFTGNTTQYRQYGSSYAIRPDRPRLTRGNERSIITSIYNRIAMDCAKVDVHHVRLDENNRYMDDVSSGLNYCLTTEANIDQTARSFIQDIVLSMLDEGVVAVVPVETSSSPLATGTYEIFSMRTAKIIEWYPESVRVNLYNQQHGKKEEIVVPKKMVAIIENPMYSVMNEPNSTMQRLIRKLSLLDAIDEENSTGKLNLIIGLPYVVKSDARRAQANLRRQEIMEQLQSDKLGIAYTDGTEKITQLNHPLENNLLAQIQYLTDQAYAQLGITTEIMNGTATPEVMLNYNSRIIEPILAAISDEFARKFLTRTARSSKYRHSIMYFSDPFALVPADKLAELADKFTRNEIMTSNEIRQIVGMKPSTDPKADELRNKNINQSAEAMAYENDGQYPEDYENFGQDLDNYDAELDQLANQLEE